MGTGGTGGTTPHSRSGWWQRDDNLIQGKEQWLCFAGAAVKTYPMSKVRETHVRRYMLQEVIRGKTH